MAPLGRAGLAVTVDREWFTVSLAGPTAFQGGYPTVYDSLRHRVYLLGLTSDGHNTTWAWDGTAWQDLHTATMPTSVGSQDIAYDPLRGVTVVFDFDGGGSTTWEFDGTTWSVRPQAVAPPPRGAAGMAFDAALGKIVMFGGTGAVLYGDTWTYDGTWQQVITPTAPSARGAAAMGYDAAHGRVLLFGGEIFDAQGNAHHLSDTWLFDGATWSMQSVSAAPQARGWSGIAYDDAMGQLVLFGGHGDPGFDNAPTIFGDTWAWTGSAWYQPATASPGPFFQASLAYDVDGGVLLLFGKPECSQLATATWEFGVPPSSPPAGLSPLSAGIVPAAGWPQKEGQEQAFSGSISGGAGVYPTVSVSWGDGSPASTPDVVCGSFWLTHTWRRGGTVTLTLSVTDSFGGAITRTRTLQISDPPLTSKGVTKVGTGLPLGTYKGEVATAHDPDPDDAPSSYRVAISWGDGLSSRGWVTKAAGSGDLVLGGSHTYAAPGAYTVTVRLTDNDGSATVATSHVVV